jgi:hypothetical protein
MQTVYVSLVTRQFCLTFRRHKTYPGNGKKYHQFRGAENQVTLPKSVSKANGSHFTNLKMSLLYVLCDDHPHTKGFTRIDPDDCEFITGTSQNGATSST